MVKTAIRKGQGGHGGKVAIHRHIGRLCRLRDAGNRRVRGVNGTDAEAKSGQRQRMPPDPCAKVQHPRAFKLWRPVRVGQHVEERLSGAV